MSSIGMSYDEAMSGVEVTAEEARIEVRMHHRGHTPTPGYDYQCDAFGHAHATPWEAFVCDNGDHDVYDSADVLAWLGY